MKKPSLFSYEFLNKVFNKYYYVKTNYWYRFFFKSCGKNNLIIKPILLTPASIILHHNVFIRNNARLEGITLYEDVSFDPTIELKDNVSIEQNLHCTCANRIMIGNNTAIAANVTITDIDHPYANIHLPPEKQKLYVKEVIIGKNCKIYNNVVLLPGVHLGNHCIVAANSVVKDGEYPDYSVLAGIPAKVIKQYDASTSTWVSVKQEVKS